MRPRTLLTGTATTGLSWATPRKTMIAPSPSDRRMGIAPSATNSPRNTSRPPAAMTQAAKAVRRALEAWVTTYPSRNPSMGGILAARRAGTTAATTVTPSPTSTAAIQVRGSSTNESEGTSKPPAERIARSTCAITSPNATPNARPVAPMMLASTITERVT